MSLISQVSLHFFDAQRNMVFQTLPRVVLPPSSRPKTMLRVLSVARCCIRGSDHSRDSMHSHIVFGKCTKRGQQSKINTRRPQTQYKNTAPELDVLSFSMIYDNCVITRIRILRQGLLIVCLGSGPTKDGNSTASSLSASFTILSSHDAMTGQCARNFVATTGGSAMFLLGPAHRFRADERNCHHTALLRFIGPCLQGKN